MDRNIKIDQETIKLLVEASSAISELNGVAKKTKNLKTYVNVCSEREAIQSTKIDLPACSIEELYLPYFKNTDIESISRVRYYLVAEHASVQNAKSTTINDQIIKGIYKMLQGKTLASMDEQETFGYKDEQSAEKVHDLLRYMNLNRDNEALIKAAIIHKELYAIKPFVKDNGRVARIINTVCLLQTGILLYPILNLSDYFYKNKKEYLEHMNNESAGNEAWVKFYLKGIASSARETEKNIDFVETAREEDLSLVRLRTRDRKNIENALKIFYESPILSRKNLAESIGITYNTAAAAICKLEKQGILEKVNERKKDTYYVLKAYKESMFDLREKRR